MAYQYPTHSPPVRTLTESKEEETEFTIIWIILNFLEEWSEMTFSAIILIYKNRNRLQYYQ